MSENICDVALIGESGVGKTSIISRFIDNNFDAKQLPSPSATYIYTEMKFDEYNTSIRFQIWDTAAQERFRSLSKIFYKKANIIILVYDITDRNSFEEMKNYWAIQIKDNSPENIILAIAANKSDLIEQETVDEEEARNFAKELNAIFVTTSAKSSEGINSLFEEIAKKYSGATNITIKEEEDGEEPLQEQKNTNTVKIENPGKENKKPKKKGFC